MIVTIAQTPFYRWCQSTLMFITIIGRASTKSSEICAKTTLNHGRSGAAAAQIEETAYTYELRANTVSKKLCESDKIKSVYSTVRACCAHLYLHRIDLLSRQRQTKQTHNKCCRQASYYMYKSEALEFFIVSL